MNYFVDFYDYAKQKKNKLLEIDFIRFAMVGCVAFLVNLGGLTLFYKHLGLYITLAQIIAGEIALLASFMLHNFWTYRGHQQKSFSKKLTQFHATQWTGQLIIIFSVSLGVKLGLNYIVALAISSILVMLWNFAWTKYYIFKKNTTLQK